MCRQEWCRQQPLRSASLRGVVKMAACNPHTSFWVPGPAQDASPSLYLSMGHLGSMQLLNADAPQAQPVRLALTLVLRHRLHAHMGRDSMLRIVTASNATPLGALVWHTIDPTSGRTLSIQRNYLFPHTPSFSKSVYNAAAHQVMGMCGKHTIAIMDADTLEEICRIHLALACVWAGVSPGLPAANAFQLDIWEWSPRGDMVALQLQVPSQEDPSRLDRMASEVHIYNTASGERMQCVQLRGACYSMSWSSSLHKLAMCCQLERLHGDGSGDQAASQQDAYLTATIRILDPALQTASLLPQDMSNPDWDMLWADCKWTPCGTLLVASYESSSPSSGIYVVDPHAVKLLYRAVQATSSLSWGSLALPGKPAATLVAYMPDVKMRVAFEYAYGEWQIESKGMSFVDSSSAGCITPDSSTLVVGKVTGTAGPTLGHCDFWSCNYEQHVIAENLHPGKGLLHFRKEGLLPWRGISPDNLNSLWTPLPKRWPGVYAFIQAHTSAQPLASLALVDVKAHRIFASWSGADLLHQTRARESMKGLTPRDLGKEVKFLSVTWSKHGRHIAAFCEGVVFVMMF